MSGEDDVRVRPGRIRSSGALRARPFVAQALAAAQKAGGTVSSRGRIGSGNRSRFGRGQRASIQANRLVTSRSRRVVIQTRVVRHATHRGKLAAHLTYLRREGVTREGEKARLFGPETENADASAFTGRCADDRHHFRFIVSPEDAVEMADLRAFTRDLVGQMETDLGTRLDWVAVDHWNTDNNRPPWCSPNRRRRAAKDLRPRRLTDAGASEGACQDARREISIQQAPDRPTSTGLLSQIPSRTTPQAIQC